MKNEKGDDYEKYHIKQVQYRDIYGNLLWETPMILRSLHGVGELLIQDSKPYVVARVAVADEVQHVNLRAKGSAKC